MYMTLFLWSTFLTPNFLVHLWIVFLFLFKLSLIFVFGILLSPSSRTPSLSSSPPLSSSPHLSRPSSLSQPYPFLILPCSPPLPHAFPQSLSLSLSLPFLSTSSFSNHLLFSAEGYSCLQGYGNIRKAPLYFQLRK